MKISVWSLTCQQRVYKRYHSGKHFSEFYPQDGGANQLAQIWIEITSLSPYVWILLSCLSWRLVWLPDWSWRIAVRALWTFTLESTCSEREFSTVQFTCSAVIKSLWLQRQRSELTHWLVVFYKKLSYRRGTARCVVSIEILPIATQQCRNYLYDKSWPNRWYEVGNLVGGNAW